MNNGKRKSKNENGKWKQVKDGKLKMKIRNEKCRKKDETLYTILKKYQKLRRSDNWEVHNGEWKGSNKWNDSGGIQINWFTRTIKSQIYFNY